MNETLTKIKKILASEQFNITDEIDENTIIKEITGWDSLLHLTFMFEIENKFNIEITPEQIKEIKSISTLIKIIEQK